VFIDFKKYAFCTPKRDRVVSLFDDDDDDDNNVWRCKELFTEFRMELDLDYMVFMSNNAWEKILDEEFDEWKRTISELD
jgi:hypothetical protein